MQLLEVWPFALGRLLLHSLQSLGQSPLPSRLAIAPSCCTIRRARHHNSADCSGPHRIAESGHGQRACCNVPAEGICYYYYYISSRASWRHLQSPRAPAWGGGVRAQGDTEKIGKMLEKAMMQRVGPAALKQHFVIMDTICDATQFRQDAVYDLVGHQEQARPPRTQASSSRTLRDSRQSAARGVSWAAKTSSTPTCPLHL